jgi:hypothetical protein
VEWELSEVSGLAGDRKIASVSSAARGALVDTHPDDLPHELYETKFALWGTSWSDGLNVSGWNQVQ